MEIEIKGRINYNRKEIIKLINWKEKQQLEESKEIEMLIQDHSQSSARQTPTDYKSNNKANMTLNSLQEILHNSLGASQVLRTNSNDDESFKNDINVAPVIPSL